jgi:phage gp46-like protein
MSNPAGSDCVLLLHFDDVNGSTNFVDSSGRAHVATAHGSAQISTAQSKFGGSSLLLNGTTDYINLDGGTDFNLGTGDFTVDCWAYVPAISGQRAYFSWHDSTNTNTWIDLLSNSSLLQLRYGPSGSTIVSIAGVVAGSWQHIAVTRASGTFYLFSNGTLLGSGPNAISVTLTLGPYIGGQFNNLFFFNGYIDEFRVVKGRAAWTANFTPPTAPYDNSVALNADGIASATFAPNPVTLNADGIAAVAAKGGYGVPFVLNADGAAAVAVAGAYAHLGAWNADGAGTADFRAVGPLASVWKADGAAAAVFGGAAKRAAAWNADGMAAAAFAGVAARQGVLKADGAAAVSFSGITRYLGVLNADGLGTAAFAGASKAAGAWTADGIAGAIFVPPITKGQWRADGAATAIFGGASTNTVVGPSRVVIRPSPAGTYTPDIRLIQYANFPTSFAIDWSLLDDGTLDDTQSLATAVIVALGTNRLALSSDILPDPDSTDRQGWWGDLDAEEIWNGWPIGSRLWLLKRSKITGPEAMGGATVTLVEQYIREALQPFIDLNVASQMYVKAAQVGRERIDALVRLYRGPATAVDLRYQILWDELTGLVTTNALVNANTQASALTGARRNSGLIAGR